MAYAALIDSQLKQAFRQVKDLALDAVFQVKIAGSFNFGSKVPEDFLGQSITAKIVVFDGEKQKADSKVIKKTFMVHAKDVPDLSGIDKITFDGQTWSVGPIVKGTGFIYVAEAYRAGG
jgi:hypothetical protein